MKKFYVPVLATALLLLCSCASKMGNLPAEYFAVTPQVLEAVGGEVPATIYGKFPQKFFKKNAILEITPVLKWNGGSEKSETVTFQGENVEGNNQTISYKMGGAFTMKCKFNYQPEMAKSELYLQFNVKIKNKSYTLPEVKVADGVIATSQLYQQTVGSATTATAEDAFQRVIKQAKEANIMFLIQQANLRASELNSGNIKEFAQALKEVAKDKENRVLDNVEVSAYASPDGGLDLNTNLADSRQNNATAYVKKQMKDAKLEGAVDSKYTAEDWEGFQELVSKSNLADKDLILRVLSMYSDPEEREAQIKNISSVYKDLTDEILPQLRRARLTLNYQLIGRSDDEIQAAFASNPSQLSIEELLYAATLTDDNSQKETIYKKVTELFPNDYRAYNNLAQLSYAKGNVDEAASYLQKAASLNAGSAEVNTNKGLLALKKGAVEDAETYLAKGAGSAVSDEALGNLYIAQGQYTRAESLLGDTKSNSAALAQILNKNYAKAKTTLAGIANPDATTSYLTAVLGARTDNMSMLYDGLKEAVKKDNSYAQKAKSDLEFAKYFNSDSFLQAIQ